MCTRAYALDYQFLKPLGMCTDPRHIELFGVRFEIPEFEQFRQLDQFGQFELFEQVVYVCFDRRTTALTGLPMIRGSYMFGPISLTRISHDILSEGINFQF